jgi:hypothetical protein
VGVDGIVGWFGRPSPAEPPLVFGECGGVSDERALGWRGHRTDAEEVGDPPEVAISCPVCARLEFGRGR